jgi:hypothetical protein
VRGEKKWLGRAGVGGRSEEREGSRRGEEGNGQIIGKEQAEEVD